MTSSSIQIAAFSFLPPRIELSSSDSCTVSAPLSGAAASAAAPVASSGTAPAARRPSTWTISSWQYSLSPRACGGAPRRSGGRSAPSGTAATAQTVPAHERCQVGHVDTPAVAFRLDAFVESLEHGDARVIASARRRPGPTARGRGRCGRTAPRPRRRSHGSCPVAPVLVGELPALERVGLAVLEAGELLVVADVQPELDEDQPFEHERALEVDDLVERPLPLLRRWQTPRPARRAPGRTSCGRTRTCRRARDHAVEAPQEVVAFLVGVGAQ